MNNLPTIQTDRLILDSPTAKDIPKIVEFAGEKAIADMTLNIPHPYLEQHAIFWINMAHQGIAKNDKYIFAIRLKESGLFIGGMGLHVDNNYDRAELGYWIAKPYWNQGYATETLSALLEFGFGKLLLQKVFATHLIENPASGKVMRKNGMIKEGELKDHYKKQNQYKTVIQYRITKQEYAQHRELS